MRIKTTIVCLAALGSLLGYNFAQAEKPHITEQQKNIKNYQLEEIKVTAEKRTENLQKVAASVTAFTEN